MTDRNIYFQIKLTLTLKEWVSISFAFFKKRKEKKNNKKVLQQCQVELLPGEMSTRMFKVHGFCYLFLFILRERVKSSLTWRQIDLVMRPHTHTHIRTEQDALRLEWASYSHNIQHRRDALYETSHEANFTVLLHVKHTRYCFFRSLRLGCSCRLVSPTSTNKCTDCDPLPNGTIAKTQSQRGRERAIPLG